MTMNNEETTDSPSSAEEKQPTVRRFSSENADLSSDSGRHSKRVYEGCVYHIGVNRLGHRFCHKRSLRIDGISIEMFKEVPIPENAKPIRKGVAGKFLRFEDAGRRKIGDKELYIINISNSQDGMTKGEIGCETASDANQWMNAFRNAKVEAGKYFPKGSGDKVVDDVDEFEISGHRPLVRRYARDLAKLIMIGKDSDEKQDDDTVDEHKWNCVRSVNGIRILQDITVEKIIVLKAVGVIEGSSGAIFEMLIDVKNPLRKEWDILTGDLTIIEEVSGHCHLLHGTFDYKYLRRFNCKKDFVFLRMWRCDPDGSYCIILEPQSKTNVPKKFGFQRIKLYPTVWEIKPLPSSKYGISRSLVTQTMEIRPTWWRVLKRMHYVQLEKTTPYIVLCQVAGLRDYFASNPVFDAIAKDMGKQVNILSPIDSIDDTIEEFYDAIAANVPEEDDDIDDADRSEANDNITKRAKAGRNKFEVLGLSQQHSTKRKELASDVDGLDVNLNEFEGSLPHYVGKSMSCWIDPGGSEFMVRGQSYTKDYMKIPGGTPLLKLLAVDWLYCKERIDFVATNKSNLVQSETAKNLPFILVVNLQVPADPNYSLIYYFGADRPVQKGSLLERFVDGTDAFRDSRLKLIPRVVEGYWFVKKAVGTKACLLGKAVSCSYLRQQNFLEIDVDIGSSSVARSIINLVLGYVTSLVVDMALLIEGRTESELPEYLLGTTRVIKIELESAKPYK